MAKKLQSWMILPWFNGSPLSTLNVGRVFYIVLSQKNHAHENPMLTKFFVKVHWGSTRLHQEILIISLYWTIQERKSLAIGSG